MKTTLLKTLPNKKTNNNMNVYEKTKIPLIIEPKISEIQSSPNI